VPHGVIAAEDCQENIIWCLKGMRWMIYQTVLTTSVYARLKNAQQSLRRLQCRKVDCSPGCENTLCKHIP
jgi:hypothetical protein